MYIANNDDWLRYLEDVRLLFEHVHDIGEQFLDLWHADAALGQQVLPDEVEVRYCRSG